MRKSLGSRLAWACLTCLSCVGQNTKSLVTSNAFSNLRLLLVYLFIFISSRTCFICISLYDHKINQNFTLVDVSTTPVMISFYLRFASLILVTFKTFVTLPIVS